MGNNISTEGGNAVGVVQSMKLVLNWLSFTMFAVDSNAALSLIRSSWNYCCRPLRSSWNYCFVAVCGSTWCRTQLQAYYTAKYRRLSLMPWGFVLLKYPERATGSDALSQLFARQFRSCGVAKTGTEWVRDLAPGNNLVVFADPGQGKTALLRHIARQQTTLTPQHITVHIMLPELRDYLLNRTQWTTDDLVAVAFPDKSMQRWVCHAVRRYDVLWLLDELDDVTNLEDGPDCAFISFLQSFGMSATTTMATASSSHSCLSMVRPFQHITIPAPEEDFYLAHMEPWTDSDVEHFVNLVAEKFSQSTKGRQLGDREVEKRTASVLSALQSAEYDTLRHCPYFCELVCFLVLNWDRSNPADVTRAAMTCLFHKRKQRTDEELHEALDVASVLSWKAHNNWEEVTERFEAFRSAELSQSGWMVEEASLQKCFEAFLIAEELHRALVEDDDTSRIVGGRKDIVKLSLLAHLLRSGAHNDKKQKLCDTLWAQWAASDKRPAMMSCDHLRIPFPRLPADHENLPQVIVPLWVSAVLDNRSFVKTLSAVHLHYVFTVAVVFFRDDKFADHVTNEFHKKMETFVGALENEAPEAFNDWTTFENLIPAVCENGALRHQCPTDWLGSATQIMQNEPSSRSAVDHFDTQQCSQSDRANQLLVALRETVKMFVGAALSQKISTADMIRLTQKGTEQNEASCHPQLPVAEPRLPRDDAAELV